MEVFRAFKHTTRASKLPLIKQENTHKQSNGLPKSITQKYLFPRIAFLPALIRGVTKCGLEMSFNLWFCTVSTRPISGGYISQPWRQADSCTFRVFTGLFDVRAKITMEACMMLTKKMVYQRQQTLRSIAKRLSSNFSYDLLFRLYSLVRIRHLSFRNLKLWLMICPEPERAWA